MTTTASAFPLSGVIGIVDSSAEQLDLALESQLRCVEIRADLLRIAGLSTTALLSLISRTKDNGLACLFTLRHADQGGTFNAAESERVAICTQALEAGADIIDLEHGTEASTIMLRAGAPMILSYHNFQSMVGSAELATLTEAMELQTPLAIKIIPTGASMTDAATMLSWVGSASGEVRRIGFSMGEAGGISRVLTLAHGAPVTYASFGVPVAPGQIDIALLLNRYHCNAMDKKTKIYAVVGEQHQVNDYIAHQQIVDKQDKGRRVWVGFSKSEHEMLEQHKHAMKISDVHVL